METKIRPGKWRYGLAAGLALVGLLACVVLVMSLLGSVEDMTRVVVPGEHTVSLDEPDSYVIFYENQSIVDGQVFSTGDIPGLNILLLDPSGNPVQLAEPSVQRTYTVGGRSGQSYAAFSVEEAGDYTLKAVYPEGHQGTPIVLAVGYASSGALLIGGFAFLAFVAALFVGISTYSKRRRSRRTALNASTPAADLQDPA